MSIFNEIQESGLNQILTRRLDIKGDVPAPAVVPEISPALVLESDRPEWGWLKGERLGARYIGVNAVAAQFSAIQLALPPFAKEIVVIEELQFFNNTSCLVAEATVLDGGLVGWSAAAAAVRDTRWPLSNALQISLTTNALQPSVSASLAANTTAGLSIRQPLVLTPGNAYMIYATAVNTALGVNIFWRERVGTASELG